MNTERLHSLIRLFIDANKKHNFISLLQAVETTYTQAVQTPSSQNAETFDNARNALLTAASEFPIGSLSPSRRKLLEAIGGIFYYGENLSRRIDDIIENANTPSAAVAQIQELRTKMTEFFKTVQVLDDSLTKLGVGVEDIPQDSAEIEVLIPESMIDGHLNGFIKEINYLDAAFSDIGEVVTGERTSLDIRSLGSGSAELYLIVDLAMGAQVLAFVTAVVVLINNILKIRRDRESLKKQNAPATIIKELKSWEDKQIKEHIDKLREEMLGKYKGKEERKNELRNALSMRLKRLADRIDRGMDIDVTTAATAEQKEGDESAADAKQIKDKQGYIAFIREATHHISQLERGQEPVLKLPVTDDESESS